MSPSHSHPSPTSAAVRCLLFPAGFRGFGKQTCSLLLDSQCLHVVDPQLVECRDLQEPFVPPCYPTGKETEAQREQQM